MSTNDTDNTDIKQKNLIHGDLSYIVNGIIFTTHNEVGPYGRERQYGDVATRLLTEKGLRFEREFPIGDSGNIVDFLVEKRVILEFKAKRILTKEDYYQTQRYLQETGIDLAILVNFRDKLVRPKRIVRIEGWNG